jgi:hypothetical protein
LTPSSKVLWYLWMYLFLLNCSTSKVMWFLNLYLSFWAISLDLLLSVHPDWYLCTYWIATNEIWKILLISFQLVPQNSFINSMLSQILFQLLCKIFFYRLPPFSNFALESYSSSSSMYNTTTSIHNPLVFSWYQLDPNSFVLVPSLNVLACVTKFYDTPCPPWIVLFLPLISFF